MVGAETRQPNAVEFHSAHAAIIHWFALPCAAGRAPLDRGAIRAGDLTREISLLELRKIIPPKREGILPVTAAEIAEARAGNKKARNVTRIGSASFCWSAFSNRSVKSVLMLDATAASCRWMLQLTTRFLRISG